jgi:two-component system KDP operon response regulator KdpE
MESDRARRRALHAEFLAAGFEVTDAESLDEGMTLCQVIEPEILLVSVNAQEAAGGVCQLFWSVAPQAVVIILTENANPDHTAEILDAGADLCLPKWTYLPELVARVRAATRRSKPGASQPAATATVGGIRLDTGRRLAYRDGVPVRLTPREFILLHHMMSNAGVPIPHESLVKVVWGAEQVVRVEYLRSLVRQLRIKLNDHESPQYLLTENWVGYRFVDPGIAPGTEVDAGQAAA